MFFNPYKFKKQVKRGVRSASCLVFSKDTGLRKATWQYHKQNSCKIKQKSKIFEKLKIVLLTVSLFGTFAILIYHPFFNINKITLQGEERINNDKLQETVKGIINYYHFGILPKKNYFLVNLSEVNDILKERYPIETIATEKIFPNELKITIKEKISQIIYDNGQKYYYLDTIGQVIEPLRLVGDDEWQKTTSILNSTSTTGTPILVEEINKKHTPNVTQIKKEMGDYPIIYDKRTNIDINQTNLNEQIVSDTISWFNQLNKYTNLKFEYLLIESNPLEGEIITNKGWNIKIRFGNNPENDFVKFQHLLQKENVDQNNLKYIDLRYLNKIYWQ
ncbi:MAG: hypothetical protein US42_C0002G0067 [Candidatus Magasanikbacteria bacterium GW2011_GWC2_37_14]|uniref:Uncharacterized protein n=1 Tax=Candidatus Magasanikbacteria bacterium GW2011_GWC2_37_14 TaxID=1619046 RepID=A0A0G0GDR3_9BACT|nr:MAG: hypothetical protein US42_C0002G0067 [Candidatus Magasanikbacteria bacterium GW2011_GWC2_37_14]